jgi:hypothetical protein
MGPRLATAVPKGKYAADPSMLQQQRPESLDLVLDAILA